MKNNLIINGLDGKPIQLNEFEARTYQNNNSHIQNNGYNIDITTLTAISKEIVRQSFYEIAPADYIPVRVGENPYSERITTYRTFDDTAKFSAGVVNTGDNNSAFATSSTSIDSVDVKVFDWVGRYDYTLLQLEKASRSGNWSLVESVEIARKTKWDLGIQEVAFWGLDIDGSIRGLLNQPDVNANTSLITKTISSMDATEFDALIGGLISAYRTNARFSAMPNTFVIPESDYNGLASFPDATYPLKTKLELLIESLKTITRNPNFQVLPSAYAVQANNADVVGLNKNVYALYNNNSQALRMDIPLNYNSLPYSSFNGFTYSSVAMGEFTGVKAYKPREMLYFTWAA